jgi:acetyl esterase/lipase
VNRLFSVDRRLNVTFGVVVFLVPAVSSRAADDVEVKYGLQYREGAPSCVLDLAVPRDVSDTPRPAIVVIHGGGWIEGSRSSFSTRENPPPGNIFDFAKLGFVVSTIDYRMSREATYPAALHDCRCAVRWLRAHRDEFHIDPDRIGAWGNSAGGHLALMLAVTDESVAPEPDAPYAEQSSRVQCAVSDSGPIDLVHQFHHHQVHTVIEMFLGGPPEGERLASYKQASPGSYVAGDVPPLLLIYGVDDEQVGVETADRFVGELRTAGANDVSYLRLAREKHCPHSLLRVPWVAPAVDEFFVRTLLKRP